jgi:hypothetical protein
MWATLGLLFGAWTQRAAVSDATRLAHPSGGAFRCPLWVNNGHWGKSKECPLYPRKRTLIEQVGVSALCQKQTLCGAAIDRAYWGHALLDVRQ